MTVVHSKYWRTPHWTYEFQYFFEVAPNAELKEQLFNDNRLRQLSTDEAAKAKLDSSGDAPTWFAPGNATAYDIWAFEKEPERAFKVLVDRTSGHIFLTDKQM